MINPFMNPYGSSMLPKTPDQVKSEMDAITRSYAERYNQMMAGNQQPQAMPSAYPWKYQERDGEVDTIQVPSNGTPFILMGNGVFWVKQFKNGQMYVSQFSFAPLNKVGEPIKREQEDKSEDIVAIISKLAKDVEELKHERTAESAEVIDK